VWNLKQRFLEKNKKISPFNIRWENFCSSFNVWTRQEKRKLFDLLHFWNVFPYLSRPWGILVNFHSFLLSIHWSHCLINQHLNPPSIVIVFKWFWVFRFLLWKPQKFNFQVLMSLNIKIYIFFCVKTIKFKNTNESVNK
jgi:hypothetical protein